MHRARNILLRTALQTTRKQNVAFRVAPQVTFSRNYVFTPRTITSPTLIRNVRQFSGVVTVPLESLGDSISSAVLVKWEKNEGDQVNEDDVVAVVETDKVTMDIRAKQSGVFSGGFCAEGDEIEVGADLYKIDTDATGAALSSTTPDSSDSTEVVDVPVEETSSPGTRQEVPVPIMGESISQGVLASWNKAVGDFVNADEVVATIETDKVTIDVNSPFTGKIVEILADEGDEIEVGGPLFVVMEGASGAPKSTPQPVKETSTPAPTTPSPATQKAAAPTPSPSSTPSSSAPPAEEKVTGNRTESRVKMTRMRQRIAQRLKESQNTAAMLTTFQEVDMGPLMEMRSKHKEEFEKVHGVKLGFMSAFVKASTSALQEIPAINAVIDDATKEIVYRNYVDVSVAVASPTGLVVPVLRNCEDMSFADVEKTIGMYGKKARDGSLSLEEMTGGTFTISNGGVFGSLFGTPIINIPQSAILGMHATKMRPMVVNGEVVARPMMYLALTYDHRLIDGREAVTFLKSIQAKIEDPSRLLLDI